MRSIGLICGGTGAYTTTVESKVICIVAALMAGNSGAAGEPTAAMADACTSVWRSLWSVGSTVAAILLIFVCNSSNFSIVSGFLFVCHGGDVRGLGWVGFAAWWDARRAAAVTMSWL
jgi:hypothetical protein